MLTKSKIIVALDSNDLSKIKKLLNKISKKIYGVKVGYEFFYNFNKKGYDFLKKKEFKNLFRFKITRYSKYCK